MFVGLSREGRGMAGYRCSLEFDANIRISHNMFVCINHIILVSSLICSLLTGFSIFRTSLDRAEEKGLINRRS